MSRKQDLVVIGGGPGGLVVASVTSQMGLKVTLVEASERLGGDCLHTGCVPSKTLIQSARIAHLMRHAPHYGLPVCAPEIDTRKIFDRIEAVISHLQQHDDPERFRSYGCDVRFGTACFRNAHEIAVGDDHITSRRFVIATGSVPAIPSIPGLDEAGYETNETIFSRRELPRRLAIIGGGPIGLELAQAFARLGSTVSIIEMADRILPVADSEVSENLAEVLASEGIILRTATQVTQVRRDGDSRQLTLSDGSTLECERILVAIGRRPATNGLGLDNAGVEFTPGGITVDQRLRTTQRNIYAIGDVCGPFQFTHMAEYQAGVVLANLLFRIPRRVDYRVIPRVTYTDPEIAQVGLSSTEAEQQGLDFELARFPFNQIDRAITDGHNHGFIKLVLNKGRLAGATLIGPHAGELIHELALAMQLNAKARVISALVHAYPTYSQIHRRAINGHYSQLLYSRKTRLLVRLINRLWPWA